MPEERESGLSARLALIGDLRTLGDFFAGDLLGSKVEDVPPNFTLKLKGADPAKKIYSGYYYHLNVLNFTKLLNKAASMEHL